jgi:MEMO1 family protein
VRVRRAAVAGAFYPARAADLAALVDRLVAAAPRGGIEDMPRALVVPHAGYQYSGSVAAAAYALLQRRRPERVVLLGPAHFVPLPGMAVPTVDAFATPLGRVPVDRAACRRLTATSGACAADRPHEREHSLEVQLPFLQRVVGDGWSLTPITVGDADPEEIADVMDAALIGGTALLVVSTDLSHGLDQGDAVDRDGRTIDAVVAGRVEAIGDTDACGAAALRGLVAWTDRHGLSSRLLDRRTSADSTGDPARVVGYAALAVGATQPQRRPGSGSRTP